MIEQDEHSDNRVYPPEVWHSKPAHAAEVHDGPLKGIIVHHSAGVVPDIHNEGACIRGIQSWHVDHNKWVDIGYNFLVCPSGNVYQGRSGPMFKLVVGAHCSNHNAGYIGICCLGDYGQILPSTNLRRSLAWLLAELADVYGATGKLDSIVRGHRDLAKTACPGDRLYSILPEVINLASKP